MCKALDDIEKAAVRKGIKQGRKEGIKEGIKQGIKRGIKQGKKQAEKRGERKVLFSLVNDGLLKLEEAAKRVNLSEQAFRSEMKKAGFKAGSRV